MEPDKTKVYISPSRESVYAFIDNEWKQFISTDLGRELRELKHEMSRGIAYQKMITNSVYGSKPVANQFPFYDPEVADAVTKKGIEVLNEMREHLYTDEKKFISKKQIGIYEPGTIRTHSEWLEIIGRKGNIDLDYESDREWFGNVIT